MSITTPVPTVPKVRTFAGDLTTERSRQGIVARPVRTAATHTPTPTAPTPVIKKSSTSVRTTPPTVTTHVPKIPTPVKKSPVAGAAPIPPFHTLKKPVEKTSAATEGLHTIDTSELSAAQAAVKPSVLAVPAKEILAVNRKDSTESDATIITDTKHNRFSLSGAIVHSLVGWWASQQKKAADRKKPKYTVPQTERRKGVIQRATTQSGRTSTADHAAVITRIKASKQTGRTIPVTTPVPVLVPAAEPQWGTETTTPQTTVSITPINPAALTAALGKPLLSSTETDEIRPTIPAPITNAPQPRIIPTLPPLPVTVPESTPVKITIISAPEVTETEIQSSSNQPNIQPAHTDEIDSYPAVAELVAAVPIAAPLSVVTPHERAPIAPRIPNIPVTIAEQIPEPLITTPPEVTVKPTANWALRHTGAEVGASAPLNSRQRAAALAQSFTRSNRLIALSVGVVSVTAIGYFGITTLYSTVTNNTVVTAPVLPTATFKSGTLATNAVVADNAATIVSTIKSQSNDENSLVEITFLDATSLTPLSAQGLFDLFGADVLVDFTESMSGVALGEYRGMPWLVLSTTDITTARGGMLDWERTISTDLQPWFGDPVHKDRSQGITDFTDGIVGTHDVRTLKDNTGTERITYGFINGNKLLITTDTTAFLNLADDFVAR